MAPIIRLTALWILSSLFGVARAGCPVSAAVLDQQLASAERAMASRDTEQLLSLAEDLNHSVACLNTPIAAPQAAQVHLYNAFRLYADRDFTQVTATLSAARTADPTLRLPSPVDTQARWQEMWAEALTLGPGPGRDLEVPAGVSLRVDGVQTTAVPTQRAAIVEWLDPLGRPIQATWLPAGDVTPKPPPTGALYFDIYPPNARISTSGIELPHQLGRVEGLAPGRMEIWISEPCHGMESVEVEVVAGSVRRVALNLYPLLPADQPPICSTPTAPNAKHARRRRRTAGITMLAVGTAAMGGGAATLASARGDYDYYNDGGNFTDIGDRQEYYDANIRTKSITSNTLIGTGVILAASGGLLLLIDDQGVVVGYTVRF